MRADDEQSCIDQSRATFPNNAACSGNLSRGQERCSGQSRRGWTRSRAAPPVFHACPVGPNPLALGPSVTSRPCFTTKSTKILGSVSLWQVADVLDRSCPSQSRPEAERHRGQNGCQGETGVAVWTRLPSWLLLRICGCSGEASADTTHLSVLSAVSAVSWRSQGTPGTPRAWL